MLEHKGFLFCSVQFTSFSPEPRTGLEQNRQANTCRTNVPTFLRCLWILCVCVHACTCACARVLLKEVFSTPRFLKLFWYFFCSCFSNSLFYLFSRANLPANAWWVILLWQWFSFSFLVPRPSDALRCGEIQSVSDSALLFTGHQAASETLTETCLLGGKRRLRHVASSRALLCLFLALSRPPDPPLFSPSFSEM